MVEERWRKLFSFRRFDRLQVFKYAELWWDGYNPRFRAFRVDCTNFVSQCLWHGGLPMEPAERRSKGGGTPGRKAVRIAGV